MTGRSLKRFSMGPRTCTTARQRATAEAADRVGKAGTAAWERLKGRNAKTWADWMTVGEALAAGRDWAMRSSGSSKPNGGFYAMEMSRWLDQYGLKLMDKSDQAKLLKVMDHRDEIVAWRAKLTPDERLKLNHPTNVLRKWQSSLTKSPKPPGAEAKARVRAVVPAALIAERDETIERLSKQVKELEERDWSFNPRSLPHDFARALSKAVPPDRLEEIHAAIGKEIEARAPA